MADQGESRGYNWQIRNKPSYSTLNLEFKPGGSIYGEAGSMVSHTPGLAIETKLFGGIGRAIKRLLAGESAFMTRYQAAQGGKLVLAPTLTGDIERIGLANGTIRISAGAFLAHSEGINIKTALGGCRSLFGGSGLFILEATGTGDLFVTGFGALYEIPVEGSFTVDTGHLVAWDAGLQYTIRKVGGWKSTFLSGEGLVMEFTGKGSVMLATRNLSAFVSWLTPWLPR
jgi:uncharacterized protein (TIGR00266 family)